MLKVYHGVAHLEFGEVFENRIDIGLSVALAMPLSALQIGKELGLGGDREAKPRGTKTLL
jgi:hypothetical protein